MTLWDIRYRGVMNMYVALHAEARVRTRRCLYFVLFLNVLTTFVSVFFFYKMYFSIFKTLRILKKMWFEFFFIYVVETTGKKSNKNI